LDTAHDEPARCLSIRGWPPIDWLAIRGSGVSFLVNPAGTRGAERLLAIRGWVIRSVGTRGAEPRQSRADKSCLVIQRGALIDRRRSCS